MGTEGNLARQRALRIALGAGAALALAGCAGVPTSANTDGVDQAAQRIPEQFAPVVRLGRAARASGDFTSAIHRCQSAVAVKPADPSILVELGDTLVDAGSIDDAIAVYGRVPGKSAARVGALVGLARAHLELAQPDKALEFADQARALAADDARVLVARSVALDMVGRRQEAQAGYGAVLAKT